VRPSANPAESVLVLLNYGPEAIRVALTPEARGMVGNGALRDLLLGDQVAAGAHRTIPIAGYGIRILVSDGRPAFSLP
jgi:hypothetical protein